MTNELKKHLRSGDIKSEQVFDLLRSVYNNDTSDANLNVFIMCNNYIIPTPEGRFTPVPIEQIKPKKLEFIKVKNKDNNNRWTSKVIEYKFNYLFFEIIQFIIENKNYFMCRFCINSKYHVISDGKTLDEAKENCNKYLKGFVNSLCEVTK
jgi:hypothetical protein